MDRIRPYVVVVETDGNGAPVHVIDTVDAYNCLEAGQQLALETAGQYQCFAQAVLIRPASPRSLHLAAVVVAARALMRMPIVGNDGAGAS
jgi:hypothetical protein